MAILNEILSSRVRSEIFRLLFTDGDAELYQREISRRSGLSILAVQQELKRLVRLDLIKARRDGNRLYYRANREHPLFVDIQNIVLKTVGLAEVLRNALGKKGIDIAFVFGSIAEGQSGASADIDLMIVGKITMRELSGKLTGVTEEIGRVVNPHVMLLKEFLYRKRKGEHFISRVLESPKLFIIGNKNELEAMG